MHENQSSPNRPASTQNGSKRKVDRAAPSPGPKFKKTRVSRACDQCRVGREKCDGIRPTCHSCEVQARSCTYNEQPKKRGIQPNYIRTLELTLAWALKCFPEIETRLVNLLPDLDGEAHQVISGKDAAKSEPLHKLWRNGLVSRQIDQMLSGATIESPDILSVTEQVSLPTSEPTPPPTQAYATEDIPRVSSRREASTRFNQTQDILANDDHSADFAEIEYLKLPENSWSLFEHYFAFTQAWLPITEKHDVLKLMYVYPAEGLSTDAVSSGDHAELWSIMALGALQRSQHDAANVARLMKTAKALVPFDEEHLKLGHVKALLIQTLAEVSKGAWRAAWLTVGHAVRILTYLSSDLGQPKLLQISRARHTFLAAYLLESIIAFRIGGQTHLQRSIADEVGFPIEDGLEEWSPWTDPHLEDGQARKSPIMAISTFNSLVKLAARPRDREREAASSKSNQHSLSEAITQLLQNASCEQDRQQPSVIVRAAVPLPDGSAQGRPSSTGSVLTSTPLDSISGRAQAQQPRSPTHDMRSPFLSIPNASTDSMPGSTPRQGDPSFVSPGQFSPANAHTGTSWDVEMSSFFDTDIFEELATLERTDSTSARPQFMQNLGFAPDLDLAEFFGADYQLSDPMLAYVQT